MSTIIRDAIIRIKLEQQKMTGESGAGKVAEVYKEVTRAAKEAEAAQRNATKATDAWAAGMKRVNAEWKQGGSGRDSWGEGLGRMKEQAAAAEKASSAATFKQIQLSERLATVRRQSAESAAAAEVKAAQEAARAQDEFAARQSIATRQTIVNFRQAGEGALRMARGIAFLSASGGENLQKLVQHVALAQGAFDVFAGGTKVFLNLASVLGGPVTAGIAGATAVIGLGVAAWEKYRSAAEEAAKNTIKALQEMGKEAEERLAKLGNISDKRLDEIDLRQRYAITDKAKSSSEQREVDQLDIQRRANASSYKREAGGFAGEFNAAFTKFVNDSYSPVEHAKDVAQAKMARQFEMREAELLRRMLESNSERFERQRETFTGQTSPQAQVAGAVVASIGGGMFAARVPALAEHMTQWTKLLNAQQAAQEKMISAYESAQRRIERLEILLMGEE